MKIDIRKWQSIMIAGIVFLVLSGCSSDDSTPEFQASTTLSLKSVSVNKFADNNQAATRKIEFQSRIVRSGLLSLTCVTEGVRDEENAFNVKHSYNGERWVPDTAAKVKEIKLTEKISTIALIYPHWDQGVPHDYLKNNGNPVLKVYTRLYNKPDDALCVGLTEANINNPSPLQTLHHIYSMLSFRFVKQDSHAGSGSITQIVIDKQPQQDPGETTVDRTNVTLYYLFEDRYLIRSGLGKNTLDTLKFDTGDNNIANILLVPRNLSEISGDDRQFNLTITADAIKYNAAIPFSSFQNELLPGVQYRFKVLIGETEVKVVPDDSVPVINDWGAGNEIDAGELESGLNAGS